jgi:hypothetical protein
MFLRDKPGIASVLGLRYPSEETCWGGRRTTRQVKLLAYEIALQIEATLDRPHTAHTHTLSLSLDLSLLTNLMTSTTVKHCLIALP